MTDSIARRVLEYHIENPSEVVRFLNKEEVIEVLRDGGYEPEDAERYTVVSLRRELSHRLLDGDIDLSAMPHWERDLNLEDL